MAITKYQPFQSIVDRFFDDKDLFPNFFDRWEPSVPVDIYEKGDKINMDFELPGLTKDDLSIDLDGNTLTVSGKFQRAKEVKDADYYRRERVYGDFSRSFTLPADIKEKDIEAKFENGILKVTFPKTKEIETKARIPIK
jgi:HSP20 family protein